MKNSNETPLAEASGSLERNTERSLFIRALRGAVLWPRMHKASRSRGVSLVAAVAIIVIAAVVGTSLASLLGVTSRVSVDYLRASRARAIAQGGTNWILAQLAGTADWDTVSNQTAVPLGLGAFDVNVTAGTGDVPQTDSLTATALNVTVAGALNGTDSTVIKRVMSERVWKLPSAAKFALFWGRRTGTTLALNGVRIDGDFWSQGTTNIPAGSTVVNGTAFRPATENIRGGGVYTEAGVAYPYFSAFSGATATYSTPPLNSVYYTNTIGNYNARLSACTNTTNINQNANLTLSGNTVCCQDFSTNTNNAGTNVVISGNGFIVANRNMNLNAGGTNGRRLTISPSGGHIVFLANRNLIVNTGTGGNHPVTGNGSKAAGIRMYARSLTGTGQLLDINNANTRLNAALLLAQRQLRVRNGADITNSTLFVNDAGGSAVNNVLTVTGAGTLVGNLAGPCSVISVSDGTPSLQVTTSASVAGLVYQKHTNPASGFTAFTGASNANRVSITGSAIINQFSGNAITNANITYTPLAIPEPPAEGFDGFATKKPDTWDGS